MFESYTDCLFNAEIILKWKVFRSDYHKVYTEEVNKIALSSDDEKRLETFDWIKTYPHGTNASTTTQLHKAPSISTQLISTST